MGLKDIIFLRYPYCGRIATSLFHRDEGFFLGAEYGCRSEDMRISQSLFYGDHLRTIGQNRKKSMEKLSSGLAINRAGDNAAGFSISTKLNAQVRGISQARRNIMDAKGLLDVAEMGLQGVNEALHRMRELSVQAASGTLSDLDRKVIQLEMDEVKKVISSAVKSSNFNTQMVMGTDNPQYIHTDYRSVEKEIGVIRTLKEYHQMMESVKPQRIESSTTNSNTTEVERVHKELTTKTGHLINEKSYTEDIQLKEVQIDSIKETIIGVTEQGLAFNSNRDHKTYVYSDKDLIESTPDGVSKITKADIETEFTHYLQFSVHIKTDGTESESEGIVPSEALIVEIQMGEALKKIYLDDGVDLTEIDLKAHAEDNSVFISYKKKVLLETDGNSLPEDGEENKEEVYTESVISKKISWNLAGSQYEFSIYDRKTDEEEIESFSKLDLELDSSELDDTTLVVESASIGVKNIITDVINVTKHSDTSIRVGAQYTGELIIENVNADAGFSFSNDHKTIYYVSSLDGRIRRHEIPYSIKQSVESSFSTNTNSYFNKLSDVAGTSYYIENEEWVALPDELSALKVSEKPNLVTVTKNDTERTPIGPQETVTSDGYRIAEGKIYFHGTAQSQVGYRMTYVKNTEFDLPEDADLYEIDGKKSLQIKMGNQIVEDRDIFFDTPSDPTVEDYILVSDGKIHLFGFYRLGVSEDFSIRYITKTANVFTIDDDIDTYTYTDSEDKNYMDALKITSNGSTDIHVEKDGHGFMYNPLTGKVHLIGANRIIFRNKDWTSENSITKIEAEYYRGTETDSNQTLISIGSYLPEFYELGSEDSYASMVIYKEENGKLSKVDWSSDNGYSYNKGDFIIRLHGNERPSIRENKGNIKYHVKYQYELNGTDKQNGFYELTLDESDHQRVEVYMGESQQSIQVKKGDDPLQFLGYGVPEAVQDGWYYDKVNRKIILVGNARPGVHDTIQVEYLLGSFSDQQLTENSSYDVKLNSIPKSYGVDPEENPKSIRVYVDGNEVAMSEENGYTMDFQTQVLSLHGPSRPSGTKNPLIEVFYVKDDFSVKIHEKDEETHEINRVFIGEDYESAVEVSPENYIYENGVVTVVGNARPDVNDVENRKINVYVKHSPPKYVEIDDSSYRYNPYVDQWMSTEEVKADIPKEKIKIQIKNIDVTDEKSGESIQTKPIGAQYFDEEGNLKEEYFYLEDGKIRFSYDLEFTEGNHQITISYEAKQVRSYEDQEFTFQAGAGASQGMNVKINTMENMLFTTDQLRLDTREYADHTINIVDGLLQKVQSEMGSLGAVQNRLDAASTNLVVLEENTTSAMSRIMDVDYAKEMMTQIKNSILEQAVIALQVHQLNNSVSILSLIS